jgi:uncharacterized protein YhfF
MRLEKLKKRLKVKAPLYEFERGVEVEREHTSAGPKNGRYAAVPDTRGATSLIAAAHLAEIPDYYTRLAKMEREGKKAMRKYRESTDDYFGNLF